MPTLGPAVLAPQTIDVPKTGANFADEANWNWSDRVKMTKVRKEFEDWADWATALSWDMVRGLSQYVDGKYSEGDGNNVYMIKNILKSEKYENRAIQTLPTTSPFPPTVSKNGAKASTFTMVWHANGNRMIEEVEYELIKGSRLQAEYTNDELSELMNLYMELIGEVLPTGVNLLDYLGAWKPTGVRTSTASSSAELDAWFKGWQNQNNDENNDDGDDEPKKIPWVLLAIAAKFLLF